jgi:ankyrin
MLLDNLGGIDKEYEVFIALQTAAKMGNIEVVKMLLDNLTDIDIEKEKEYSGFTALYLAAEEGHTSIVELLLKHGANINTECKGCTALHIATKMGKIEVVKMLLAQKGIIVPKHDLLTSSTTQKEILDLLESHNALFDAITQNDIDKITALLTAGVNPNHIYYNTPLISAIFRGQYDIIKMLLDNGADINQQIRGCTPLYVAAQEGHASIVELLLTRGANINQQYKKGFTALHIAAKMGKIEVVKMLLAQKGIIVPKQ